MAVTADEYELPVYVADSVVELSKYLNRNANTLHSAISKGTRVKSLGMKLQIIRVEIDDEEDSMEEKCAFELTARTCDILTAKKCIGCKFYKPASQLQQENRELARLITLGRQVEKRAV